MKVTEQIDAHGSLGDQPFRYLVVTRVLAATCVMPLLVVFADTISIFSSYLAYNISWGHVAQKLVSPRRFQSSTG